MSKYNSEHLQEMAKICLQNTGTMEYIAIVNIIAGMTGNTIEETVRKISNLAKCGKEECE